MQHKSSGADINFNDGHFELLSDGVEAFIRSVIGDGPAALHEPLLDAGDLENIAAVVGSGFVSSVGETIQRFETDLCDLTGAKHAVAVVNGTAALHLSLHCMGIEPNDEVLLPSLTFAASGHAVMMAGATPHFVDSCASSLGVDCDALRAYLTDICDIRGDMCFNRISGKRIRAIMPVHIFGHIGDMEALVALADEFNLCVVEDAAEALGSWKNNTHAGLFGDCGALSFNGNKIITTGGGGAVLTDNDALAAKFRHVAQTAKQTHQFRYFHDQVGFNYRMPALNAALGISQLRKLPHFIEIKKSLAETYYEKSVSYSGFGVFKAPVGSHSNNWLNAIKLDHPSIMVRDQLLSKLNASGLGCRPIWELLSTLPHMAMFPSMPLSNATGLAASIINIPSGVGVVQSDNLS